ncbi:MAG: hypothetical protein K2X42_09775 [Burkholderiaceae bacterium]|nr:hypothetical protein [Burkholderiaceae bacterium]
MPHPHLRRSLLSTLSIMTMVLVLPWSGSAQADANPYYIGASTSVAYDSNVFRLPQAVSDTIYSLGLVAGVDQTIGRQRLYANGILSDTRFVDQKQINYTRYSFLGGIDWQTVYSLSGTLSYSSKQNLYSFGGTNTIQSTAKNLERQDEVILTGRYGGASLLSLDTSLTHRKLRYSDPTYRFNALEQDSASVGLTYRPRASLTLGSALRYTQGTYALSQDFDRYDLDLTGYWIPTGLSTFNARLSFSKRKSRAADSELDFSGTTGQLNWTYQPTGKLSISTSFSRDSGAESSFIDVGEQQIGGPGDNSVLTNSLAVSPIYALTSKIQLNANLRLVRRSLARSGLSGKDTVRSGSLGFNYTVMRNAKLGCDFRRETRNASGDLSFDYRGNLVACSAQIVLK